MRGHQAAVVRHGKAVIDQQHHAFPSQSLLGFAVMGGVFGEGVDLTAARYKEQNDAILEADTVVGR